jgi:hypothetical protein
MSREQNDCCINCGEFIVEFYSGLGYTISRKELIDMPNIKPIKTDNERINPLIRPLTIPHKRGIAKNMSK